MRGTKLALTALAVALCTSPLSALPADQIEGWRGDLERTRAAIAEIHPDPWRRTPRTKVEQALDALSARLPELTPAAATVGLAEILAALGDGHTRLSLPLTADSAFVQGHVSTEPPELSGLRFHVLPLRLGIYEEGVFVERIEARHGRLAGARVLAVGGVSIDEAMARLAPVIRHDNAEQLRDLLPMHLVVPELLHAKGLSDDPTSATWTLVSAGAEPLRVTVASGEPGLETDWETALGDWASPAPSFRHLEAGLAPRRGAFRRPYWFQLLPGTGAIYLQYNVADDDGEEDLLDFAARLRHALADARVIRLIVDLRWNWGGNNSKSRGLLHALIATEKLHEPGALVVLVGRGTFSAGMMFATDLERHLRPIFVGEPTGSSPNHAGDARLVRLPFTGLTLRISTLWWQYGGPRDTRSSISPHLKIASRWRDLAAGRDAALEAVLLPSSKTALTGRWRGTMTPPTQQFPLELTFEEEDGQLSGLLSAGELGTQLQLDEYRRKENRVRFCAKRPTGDLEFVGVVIGPRILGRVIYAGIRSEPFAFALEREGGN